MSDEATANLGLPLIQAAQAQKHVTHNEALHLIDTLVQLAVLDRDLAAPPGSPAEGQRFIVAASPTGAWSGHANHVAAWQDGEWAFSVPLTGWVAYVVDEGTLAVWNGTAWGDFFSTVTSIQNLALLGVGTTADATNPLSAKLNNALWTAKTVAEGGDGNLRYKLSKESASKTLSFLFQDNFSGRAEIGLTGDDNFHLKTSVDGSTWIDSLVLDGASGSVDLYEAESALASAATTDLGSVTTMKVVVTGTTTITSFGVAANRLRLIRFAGALTLAHNATSLILPGAANIATAAGDCAIATSDGSGNWRVRDYMRASGQPVAGGAIFANQAEAEGGTSNLVAMTPQDVSQHQHANAHAVRNIAIRNGGLEVWQRGSSIAVAASTAAAYTADGWYLKTGANQASVVSRASGIIDGSIYAAKVLRNSGQTGTGTMRLAFPLDIDELARLRGKAAVLSFEVKAGANWSPASGTLNYAVYVGTGSVAKRNGSAYTGDTTVIGGSVNLTTTAAQVVSALSSTISSSIACAEIEFTWAPSGTAGADDSFTVDNVDLRVAPAALAAVTPSFEHLPFGTLLDLCEVHFEKSTLYGTAIGAASDSAFAPVLLSTSIANGSAYLTIKYRKRKRSNPTPVTYPYTTPANTSRASNNAGTDYAAVSCDPFSHNEQGFTVANNSGGAITITANYVLFSWYADASI